MSSYEAEFRNNMSKRLKLLENVTEYKWLANLIKEYLPDLEDVDIGKIIEIASGVCSHCFENFLWCQCWNDE